MTTDLTRLERLANLHRDLIALDEDLGAALDDIIEFFGTTSENLDAVHTLLSEAQTCVQHADLIVRDAS